MNESKTMIHKAMIAVMREILPIKKDQKTATGPSYSFRSVYGVYKAIQPLLAIHGIFMRLVDCEQLIREHGKTKSGTVTTTCLLKLTYAFVAEDGSNVTTTVIAEGTDMSDKAYNKALSVGHKYAILQTFCIPDEDLNKDDPENEHIEVSSPSKQVQEIYHAKNVDQNKRLVEKLNKMKISSDRWDDVSEAMNGKLMNEDNLNASLILCMK